MPTNLLRCGFPEIARALGVAFCVLFFAGFAFASDQNGGASSSPAGVAGVPWRGEPGVSETVGSIMAREAVRRRISGILGRRVLPFRTMPNRGSLPENPDSSPVSCTPAPGGAGLLVSVGAFAAQTIGPINFTGATLADTAAFPPDSMGAAGPTQFIVAVNGRIRSFNKADGTADGILDLDTDTFFASVMTPPLSSNFTSDPRIRYDRLSGRWFITMIDVPGGSATSPNRIMIAVSSGSTITSSSNFTFFEFQHDLVGTTPNADTGLFADYPTLGIDANALYIGANVFSPTAFINTTVFVVRKSSILGTGGIVVTSFRSLIGGDGPFTPQGVDNYDPAATQGYFIGVSAVSFGELILLRVSNPGDTPSLSSNIAIAVPDTSLPLLVPHKGSTGGQHGYLDALDDRLFAAHLRNGSLWTAHNIAVNSSGIGIPGGDRDGSRWYEITDLATTPSVRQSGTVFDPAPSNPLFYWIPTVMVSGQGHAALGFSTAGAAHYADAAITGRLAADALGTTEAPLLYTGSATAYNPPGDHGGQYGRRWGDYSYTSLDPTDDMTMWTIQEFCNATNSYGVQVVKLLAPPPATPVSVSPSSVPAGQASVDIIVTGSSVAGSGFFDPGAGFTGHIGAAISGVTVNSVNYTDPTHVTVNISTVGSPGESVAVTITNPDGQFSTSASPILTVTCPTTTVSPGTIPAGTKDAAYSQAFTPVGGAGPYTLSLTGMLPVGMAFIAGTGVLSGTPTETGGFPFTISAVDSSGCSGSASYTLRVAEPAGTVTDVRIDSAIPAYYDTVQGTIDAAVNGDSIQMRTVDFTETLLFDIPAAVTMSGGYNTDYSSNLLSYTAVTGSLTISAGTVTIENVILH